MKNPVIKLLVIVVLFSQCCFFESLAPIHPTRIGFELNANEWVSLSPEKKEYKVGDTLSITYKIPAKIGKYAYGISRKDFNLRKHITPTVDSLITEIDRDMIDDHIRTGSLTYIADGKKLEVKENRLYYHIYKYDESSDAYICNYQIVFFKPNISFFGDVWASDQKIQIFPDIIYPKGNDYKVLDIEGAEVYVYISLKNNEVKEFKVVE